MRYTFTVTQVSTTYNLLPMKQGVIIYYHQYDDLLDIITPESWWSLQVFPHN